ncbi:MAG: DUF6188 family protein [Acidimicrobiales bacterium]|jgi:hypothetical protein
MSIDPPFITQSDGTTRKGRMVHPGRDWDLDLHDVELSYFRIDHQTCLQFGDTVIQIGSPLTLRVEGETYTLDEAKDLGPLLRQYPDTLATGTVDEDGTLRLAFRRGWTVDVPPDAHYEAWQIAGPGNALVVCPPGGGSLAVWANTEGS